MIFYQLLDQSSCTYTYLIASNIGREGLLIDPVLEQIPHYEKLLAELDLKLILTIDTHMHADHITATGNLRQKFNSKIVMGKETKAEHVTLKISDGEILKIDGICMQAIHTPGHTDDSYSFILNDRVFTGDTLLINSTGRTDFQNGDALAQYDSIFNKLLKLPEQTLVYPAHDYNGRVVSTIGDERKTNPRLQVKNAKEYADIMVNLNLAPPKMISIAVPANLKCGIS